MTISPPHSSFLLSLFIQFLGFHSARGSVKAQLLLLSRHKYIGPSEYFLTGPLEILLKALRMLVVFTCTKSCPRRPSYLCAT